MRRNLRILFTAVCSIVVLLLLALWVRSYHWRDAIGGSVASASRMDMASWQGRLHLNVTASPAPAALQTWSWNAMTTEDWVRVSQRAGGRRPAVVPTKWFSISRGTKTLRRHVSAPHWVVAGVIAVMAAAPWATQVKWRFSMMSLLIVTTLIAALLAIVRARDWVNTEPQNTIPQLPPQSFPQGPPKFTPVTIVPEPVR